MFQLYFIIIIFNNKYFIHFSINLPLLEYITSVKKKLRMSDYYSAHSLPYFSSDSLATTLLMQQIIKKNHLNNCL